MKKKILITIGMVIAVLLIGYIIIGNPIITYHNYCLRQNICKISETEVTLNEVIPFEWDTVYTFSPYTTHAEIEEIIGFKSGAIQETVSEGMVQLLFVKGNSVVASVCGYANNLRYCIDFVDKVEFEDHIIFDVSEQDGIVYLTER